MIDLGAVVFVHCSRRVEQCCQHIRLDISDLACVFVKAVENILDMRGVDIEQPRSDNLPRQLPSGDHAIRGLRNNRFKHELNHSVQTFRAVAFDKNIVLDIALDQLAIRARAYLINLIFDFFRI